MTTASPSLTKTGPTTTAAEPRARAPRGLRLAFVDAMTITWRNILGLLRTPEIVVLSTIQPVIFVLNFRYVFGGAIRVPGVDYVDFLMPGIFVQTVAFGAISTGVGLADDLGKGLIERFRSLPMARSAVLAGRTLADLVRDVVVIILMVIVGFLVGFRVHTNAWAFLAAMGVLLVFAFALAWVFATIGLAVGSAEGTQAASFPILAVLVFASNAFVPTETMPSWLQGYAENQPVSKAVEAVRALCLGGETLQPVLTSLAWSVGIIAVFAPLAVARYRRAG
jgi:ABC-2 type transport system permease protein